MMSLLNIYCSFLIKRPFILPVLLLMCTSLSVVLIWKFSVTKNPDLKDPRLGFSVRGTEISNKMTTFTDILKWTSLNAPKNERRIKRGTKKLSKNSKVKSRVNKNRKKNPIFCDVPRNAYSRFVVTPERDTIVNKTQFIDHMFNMTFLQKLRKFELQVYRLKSYRKGCIRDTYSPRRCCRSWSLQNYIRRGSVTLKSRDVQKVRSEFETCLKYYDAKKFYYSCFLRDKVHCNGIPRYCNIQMLELIEFILPKLSDKKVIPLVNMVLLPISKGESGLKLYRDLEALNNAKDSGDTSVSILGVDFGCRDAVFEQDLHSDVKLLGISLVIILFLVYVYSHSILISVCGVASLFSSAILAYFVYSCIVRLVYFPLVNVLAVVIVIAVGSDNIFVYIKAYDIAKENHPESPVQALSSTLRYAGVSNLITALSTGASFFSLGVSDISDLVCFGVFSGLVMIVNFVVSFLLLPSLLVINDRCRPKCHYAVFFKFTCFERFYVFLIKKLRYLFIFLFAGVSVLSFVAVFYRPGFKMSFEQFDQVKLFHKSHLFETYSDIWKKYFIFEEVIDYTMPMNFVFGVNYENRENVFNPYRSRKLNFDLDFDVASPQFQGWMLDVCERFADEMKTYYYRRNMINLMNCFSVRYAEYLDSDCIKQNKGCCELDYPVSRSTFHRCLPNFLNRLNSIQNYFNDLNTFSGIRFYRGKPKALILSYSSSMAYKNSTYEQKKEFISYVDSWFKRQLVNSTVKGWFTTEPLQLYSLQKSLVSSTPKSLAISLTCAMVLTSLATLDPWVTSSATLCVVGAIGSTVAALVVLLHWTLGIVESAIITLTVGLVIDFTLHYARDVRCSIVSSISMAALTTLIVGLVLLFAQTLAFLRLATFLVVVSITGWLYASFFFKSMHPSESVVSEEDMMPIDVTPEEQVALCPLSVET